MRIELSLCYKIKLKYDSLFICISLKSKLSLRGSLYQEKYLFLTLYMYTTNSDNGIHPYKSIYFLIHTLKNDPEAMHLI